MMRKRAVSIIVCLTMLLMKPGIPFVRHSAG